jgi:RNA-directed DNA polymerase
VPAGTSPGGAGKGNRNPAIHAAEKSDIPIVPKNWPNNGCCPAEAREGRGIASENALDSPACRTQSRVSASKGVEGIRERAKHYRREKFTALHHHITPALLRQSFYRLKRNAAAGVDGVTWRQYEEQLEARIPTLHRQLQVGGYRAQASLRAYIQKADGKQRPLGIAALEDKVVQQAVVTILSAIYESDFLGFSYGFRPGRGQHDALDAVWNGINGRKIGWILDADISAFFDTIDHGWMMRFLAHRIADRRLLKLIEKWLKAGVIEDGVRRASERGTPQGAVISPLLANIYLHYVFDLWAHRWRGQHANGDVIVVRYADDTIVGFQYEGEARTFLSAVQDRLKQFGLAVNPQKTRLIEFGRFAEIRRQRRGLGRPETFDFLGFTHCCSQTRQGYFKILRLTMKKRMRATLAAIRVELRAKLHEPVAQVGRWLKRVVQGYFNYHAVPDNLRRLQGFRDEVCRAWLQCLRRRSQRHRMTWVRFKRLIGQYVPRCRRHHPYPPQRNRVII